jgi:transposase
MPKAYSADMRERVIAEVEGGASRREAAEEVEVSASTAIIWVKCFRETGRCAAKPRGGSVSPLEEYADFLLGLIKKEPDLTLDEVALAMRKHKIPGSRTAVWRFFKRTYSCPNRSIHCPDGNRVRNNGIAQDAYSRCISQPATGGTR